MVHKGVLIVDYGPRFLGHAFKVDNGIVCVVPDRPESRTEVEASMREMVKGFGEECGRCRNCPLGGGG